MARASSNRNHLPRERAVRPPLDRAGLDRLAIDYVGRYATTRAKLAAYLHRKLRERGWDGAEPAPVEAIVVRVSDLGYVDDRAFAVARDAALARRGFGARRREQALRAAGISAEDRAAIADPDEDALASALAFARRRRIGPFARTAMDEPARRRGFAALMRAGHDPATAAKVLAIDPAELETTGPE